MTHKNHNHHHVPNYNRAFAIGITVNVVYIVVEVIYGLIANSSALLADAGHNTSDVLGLFFAWFAIRLALKQPQGKYTYGYKKSTILISVFNALLLFAAIIAISWDAIGKFSEPQVVAGTQVMLVAGIGVLINTLTALLFMKGQKHDLNIRGAFLHMAADAAVSIGVVLAGLMINITGAQWIDPLMSFIIILVILWGTWHLFIDSVDLALDAVPKHIDIEKVRLFLLEHKGVENIHDLHIWAMSTSQVALTVHLVMPQGFDDSFIAQLQEELHLDFDIEHTTFQIENKRIDHTGQTDC